MKKHVLVVDDDQGISEVIKIILSDSGYVVDVISDSLNVEERINKIKPDLILLDIWMSGIDGRDIIKYLKGNKDMRSIPVIVISALSNTEKIATEAGADDFLAKPFDINDLLESVKKYVK